MPGYDSTSIQKVLSRIEEIKSMTSMHLRNMNGDDSTINSRSKFTEVLDNISRPVKTKFISNQTSYDELKDIIDKYADKYNIDQELIRAMIQVESGWHVDAISNKGAIGLMQLMPKTAAALGVDPNDPVQNLEGGIRYISDLTDRYRGDVEKALAAYNAGPTRVDAGNIPDVSKRYVRNIMAIYNKLRG